WYSLPLGDVGGRQEEVEAAERQLGRVLPPAVREYVAYAHDVGPPERLHERFGGPYTMVPVPGQPALSLMLIAEGNVHGAARYTDLDGTNPDPPVFTYSWVEEDDTRFRPAPEGWPTWDTVTGFVLGFVSTYKPTAGVFATGVRDVERLREQMLAAFPI